MRIGLRSRAILLLFVTVASTSGATAYFTSELELRPELTNQLQRRARMAGLALAGSRDVAAAASGTTDPAVFDAARAYIRRVLQSDRELVYIVVVDALDTPILWESSRPEVLVDSAEDRRVLIGQHKLGAEDQDIVRATLPLELRQPLEVSALVGLSPDESMASFIAIFARSAAVLAGASVLLMWLFFAWLFSRLNHLKQYAARLASGDLTHRLSTDWGDELGDLAKHLESITQNLGEMISRVRVASFEVESVSSRISDASRQIAGDAGTQAMSVRQTVAAMSLMSASAHAVEAQITDATRSAEVSADRLREIGGAVQTVSSSVDQLAAAIEQTRRHIESNVAFFSQLDHAVDALNRAAEGTAVATAEITANISSVERNTEHTLEMSKQASERASSGVSAVKDIVEGIASIRDFVTDSVESVRHLSEKIGSIQSILEVINDIAAQTKMLSLNASIIAVQAGEHGRGFLVVADEIKGLATKTAGATQEIAELIEDVQEASGRVIDVAQRGVITVDEGAARSKVADGALNEIQRTVTETALSVRGIARAMTEQTRGTQQVDTAMQAIHTTAVQVRELLIQQKRQGQGLEQSMTNMRQLMERSLATSSEQAEQVQQAIAAISSLFQQIRRISEQNIEQVSSRDEVTKAVEVLESLAERHRASARGLANAVEVATNQSEALVEGIQVFRV